MAKDDAWKRYRDREDEAEAEAEATGSTHINKGKDGLSDRSNPKIEKAGLADKFDDLIQRADPMIEQLNNLYKMFAAGVETLPPHERRKQLDQLMLSLQMMGKSGPTALFKFNSIQSKYQAHCEKWDRTLRDIESGKIKRITGPRRAA